jgi:hypothetical protein
MFALPRDGVSTAQYVGHRTYPTRTMPGRAPLRPLARAPRAGLPEQSTARSDAAYASLGTGDHHFFFDAVSKRSRTFSRAMARFFAAIIRFFSSTFGISAS